MDVAGTPFQYGGAQEPLLSEAEDALYLALRCGNAMAATPHFTDGHFSEASLRTIAERMECDAQVIRLRDRVECRAGYGDRREGGLHAVAACVTIYWQTNPAHRHKNGIASINAAAACRLANRLDSGMEPLEAIERTLADCERRELTKAQVEQMERNATAWNRRLDTLDREYNQELGSEAHRDAIRVADTELGRV